MRRGWCGAIWGIGRDGVDPMPSYRSPIWYLVNCRRNSRLQAPLNEGPFEMIGSRTDMTGSQNPASVRKRAYAWRDPSMGLSFPHGHVDHLR